MELNDTRLLLSVMYVGYEILKTSYNEKETDQRHSLIKWKKHSVSFYDDNI
jgi:hypothetical protein